MLGSCSRDPIGFKAGQANIYEYVASAPLYRYDPSGLHDYLCNPGGACFPNGHGIPRSTRPRTVAKSVPCKFSTNKFVHVKFKDCSAKQQAAASASLCTAAQTAWAVLDPQTDAPFDRWFSKPELRPGYAYYEHTTITKCDRRKVDTCLAKTALAFDHEITIECESNSSGLDAYVYTGGIFSLPWTSPAIHVAPSFFDGTATHQAAIILHEMTHEACGTKDYDYFSGLPVVDGIAPWYDDNDHLDPRYTVGNASSYEGFYEEYMKSINRLR